ncbi:MAG: hypothetical protein KJO18_06495 [Acidimicrobiia bacterium]|nr:hypothetical protein [Acidimicrobiia bacterium]NNF43686.1 hypothetical protein [Phycisphaerales bacterium]
MNTPPDGGTGAGPDQTPETESAAHQRFVHGLLEFMHKDEVAQRDHRVRDAIDRITASDNARRRRLIRRVAPLATAAVLVIAIAGLFVLAPQPSAYAMVEAAIEATRSAPGLRYEISIDHAAVGGEETAIGTLDLRGDFMLARIETQHGHDFVMGRDAEGEWSIRLDGTVERSMPRAAAPRWINTGERTILVGSLVGLLEQLEDGFVIEEAKEPPSENRAATEVVATRRRGIRRPGPDQIIVWIEPGTALVDRLELQWHGPARHGEAGRGGRRHPPTDPHGDRPPPPPPELLGGPPRFDQGHNPPPPPRIVFQRTESPDLTDEEFSPPVP